MNGTIVEETVKFEILLGKVIKFKKNCRGKPLELKKNIGKIH